LGGVGGFLGRAGGRAKVCKNGGFGQLVVWGRSCPNLPVREASSHDDRVLLAFQPMRYSGQGVAKTKHRLS
jgi:hypothetical protein